MVVKIGTRFSKNVFMNEKMVDLYLNITSGPLNYVCNKLGLSYSHSLKVIDIWESMELIVKNKAGYRYNIFYTAKGKTLSDGLSKIKTYLKRGKIQW
jgi:predicted transcriptional regulator